MQGSHGHRRKLLAGLLGVCALALGSVAEAGSITVRWRHATPERAAGFRVHLGSAPGEYTRSIDVGRPQPDRDGVYQVQVEVPDAGPTFVAVSAYGERGEESPRSNETVRGPTGARPAKAAPEPAPPAKAAPGRVPAAKAALGTPGRPQVVDP